MEITTETQQMIERMEQELLVVHPEIKEELEKIEEEDQGLIEYMQSN